MYRNNNTLICFSFFNMVSVIVNCHLQGCSKPKRGVFLVVGGGGRGGGAQSKKKTYNFALCRGFGFSPGEIFKFVIIILTRFFSPVV